VYPLGTFADLKHRQLARRVGVIITTGRIRRTLVNKINLLVDSPRSIEASRLALVKAESIFYAALLVASARQAARRAARRRLLRVTRLVPLLVVPLVVDYSTSRRLVVDYFASAARPGASAHHAARDAAHLATCRQLLRVAQARRRLLRLRRASGCLGTLRGSSRGSSRRSSSTTFPPPHVRVPRHVARLVTRLVAPLVVDNFASATRPGASARRAARHAAHRRLLHLRRASGCFGTSCGTSRGSSRRSSSTTPRRAARRQLLRQRHMSG
jgi:hypothetical protein